MSHLRAFQTLVITSALCYFSWTLLPYLPIHYSSEVIQMLKFNGYEGTPIFQHPALYIAFGAIKLASSIGLFFFLAWGRWLMIALIAISISMIPFNGISVVAPLDSIIGAINGLVDGAVIALAFSAPINQYWHRDT